MRLCAAWDRIYITAGSHPFKFLEALNSQGSITAINVGSGKSSNIAEKFENVEEALNDKKYALVSSEEEDSTLISFNGNYTLENITLDCRKVRLGLHCRFGTITLKNCILIGDKPSTTSVGILVNNGATCVLDNSIIRNFATAISCTKGGKIILKNSIIGDCFNGLDISDESVIEIESSKIEKNRNMGITVTGNNLIMPSESNKIVFESLAEMQPFLK